MIVAAFFLPLTAYAQSSRYGESFLQAEDFTGDSVPDLIVADPGDFGGIGSLYIFYGPVSGDPLPPPEAADVIIQFDSDGLLDTGWRIKQACDYNFDDIADLYIDASILREDGTLDDRLLIVDPVHWRVLSDFWGGPEVPDYWEEFDGSECDVGDWMKSVLRDWGYDLYGESGDDDSSSPSSPSDGFGVINVVDYTFVLFDINPKEWARNLAGFKSTTSFAGNAARGAIPKFDTMTPEEKTAVDWERNAMRHALWQGALTRRFGADIAEEIGDIHERGEEGTDTWIDQYNNAVARNIVQDCLDGGNCTWEEMIRRILEALEDNRFIKSPCDLRVPPEHRHSDCFGIADPVPLGDVNSDGSIDTDDLLRVSEEYGNQFITADLNGNGIVDVEDIVEVAIIVGNQE